MTPFSYSHTLLTDETNTFPMPRSTSDFKQAPSIASGPFTEMSSQDGEEQFRNAPPNASRSIIGSYAGRSGLDPARPPSAVSSNTHRSTRSPPSRRGVPYLGGWKAGGAFGGPGGTVSTSSRPQSATSRISRTHVPSIAAHAFFRPMSSQRLQAQRRVRPSQVNLSAPSVDGFSETGSIIHRNSMGSNTTGHHELSIYNDMDLPPASRGTEFSEPDGRDTINASPTGNATVQSTGGSERPLQTGSSDKKPKHHSNDDSKQQTETQAPVRKSTMSFSANFLVSTKREMSGSKEGRKLAGDSSPNSPASGVPPQKSPKTGANYQYFSGNTIFCWSGRFQNARDQPINIATGIMVVVPSILFLFYSGPWLWRHISPAIPILYAYIFMICTSSFIHASVTDPGILPRNIHPMPPFDQPEDPLTLSPSMIEWTMVVSGGRFAAAMDVPSKYCKTCSIWRPPRCFHCRICDNCVETQDHHCAWLNNCVGRRNYRYFFTFVGSAMILAAFLTFASLGHCLQYQSLEDVTFRESIAKWRVPFAMFIYGALALTYPAGLWAYHAFLVSRGETTREYLNSHKFLRKDRHRPFTQGNLLRNWLVVLLRPRTPTYLRFKAEYEEGDQRFGPRRSKRGSRVWGDKEGDLELGKLDSGH